MARKIVAVLLLTLLIGPLGFARPSAVGAQGTVTIVTTERGGGGPALYACYSVEDLTDAGTGNGGVGSNCDGDDGAADGTTQVILLGSCDPCRVTQKLPNQPDHQPTSYLLEPQQIGTAGQTYTFGNFLKPFLVVNVVDARTGGRLLGACIAVADLEQGGGAFGGCDGAPSDLDGQRDGRIKTYRLAHAGTYRVDHKSPPPAGYVLGASLEVIADPALTGEFEAVTIKVPLAPRIVVKTVDSRTGKRLKGACYAITDSSHGGGLGTFCDGKRSGTFGDQDGVANGSIVTRPLPVGHTFRLNQTSAPRGYRLVGPDRLARTAAGINSTATFKNRPRPAR